MQDLGSFWISKASGVCGCFLGLGVVVGVVAFAALPRDVLAFLTAGSGVFFSGVLFALPLGLPLLPGVFLGSSSLTSS